ncbi:MAG: hypothetical protein LUQ59_04230 [Methanothrix sp.]|nr:hypothetical protein [Methanothrix sp.]
MSMDSLRGKHRLFVIVALIIVIAFLINVDATIWSSKVKTNTSAWSIERDSQNISFELTQSVRGVVSPVDYRGRSLSPYHSSFYELQENDVLLRSRTSALEGNYSLEGSIFLKADTTESVNVILTKVANSPYILVNYFESWPVIIKSNRQINYSGENINDMSLVGNNQDFLASNFLYNKQLFAKTNAGMLLTGMNATVLAMLLPESSKFNDTLISVNFKPNREMIYGIWAESTGIADLNYKLTDSEYDFKHSIYPTVIESDERYAGRFSILRNINSKTVFLNSTKDDRGIPCCFDGHSDLFSLPKEDFGLGRNQGNI